jgi:hypothetical protein
VNKKKKKILFAFLIRALSAPREAEQKSFLVTFFQKSDFFLFPSCLMFWESWTLARIFRENDHRL